MRTGKYRYGLAACLAAAAVTASQLCAWAAAPFVGWQTGDSGNQAEVLISLAKDDDLPGGVSALQLGIQLDVQGEGDVLDVEFAFDSQIRADSAITIKDCVYDEEQGVLTVFAAGNDITLLEPGKTKKLGTITAKATEDVLVYAVEAIIAGDGEKKSIDLGDSRNNGWTLKSSGEEPSDPDTPSDPDNPSNPSFGGGIGGGRRYGSSSGSKAGIVYQEPFAAAQETAGTWEWTGSAWKFKLSSGVYARDSWIYVKGEWYHMDPNGVMNTLWYQTSAGSWYYLGNSGAMKRGWIDLADVRYHLNEDSGKMDTGWFYCSGSWFYAQGSGAMATGWQLVNDKWYYLNPVKPVPVQVQNPETGQMEESIEGQRLYGAMYAAETTPDGYAVDENGVRQ